jgi:hypothetical protein
MFHTSSSHAPGVYYSAAPFAFRATYEILCGASSQKLGMVCCSSTCIKQALAKSHVSDARNTLHRAD